MNGWEGYPWPKWVPKEVREQIDGFCGSHQGRTSLDWCENGVQRYNQIKGGFLAFGDFVLVPEHSDGTGRWRRGRWIHCWNNIGRVVLKDGSYLYASTCYIKRAR